MAPTMDLNHHSPSAVRSSMLGQGQCSLGAQRRSSSAPRTYCRPWGGRWSRKTSWRDAEGRGSGRGKESSPVLPHSRHLSISPPGPELSRVPEVSGECGSPLWPLQGRGWRAWRGWGQIRMSPGCHTTPGSLKPQLPLSIKWGQIPEKMYKWQKAHEKILTIISH